MSSIVIVGAGECGGRAALQLRERGFAGGIILVGSEDHAPYERPPLSKDGILAGADPKFITGLADYESRSIDLRTGTTVTAIDRVAKQVRLSDGSTLAYDRLLLTTGARPRPFPEAPDSARILSLRSHADALRIRQHLCPGRRIAIIGGGFIGLELAAVARGLDVSVTVIEGLPRILSRGVPPEIASEIAERHLEAGVDLLCNTGVDGIDASENEVRIRLKTGQSVTADIAVVGIGSIPNIDLAAEAGLAIDNGIAVDHHLRTSDPDILAAGDCCSSPIDIYGGKRMRLESWRSAQDHALLAAANLMDANEPLRSVPWFWSDQYDLTLQVAGLSDGAAQTVRRDLGDGAFILFQLDADGRLISASGIGRGNAVARDIRLAEMLIAAGKSPDPAALAAPETKLKALLAA